jgi:hypothetical protein
MVKRSQPGSVPHVSDFAGTKIDLAHSWGLNHRCGGGGTGDNQVMNDKTGKKSRAPGNQQVVKEAVSSKLKAYYDDIARQEVPQRFLDLLQDLDRAGEKPSDKDQS